MFEFALRLLKKGVSYQVLAVEIFENFVKIRPSRLEDYIEYLVAVDNYEKALKTLYPILEDKYFASTKQKTRHDYWLLFCNLARSNSQNLDLDNSFLNINRIIRFGIGKYRDQAGFLWCTLGECFVKQGNFKQACDIYEEGMSRVVTVHDFSIIFDAYAQFQESLVSAKIQMVKETGMEDQEIDEYLAKLDGLLDRRPFLVNDVMLRQNPNNIMEWKKRLSLLKNNSEKTQKTFETALDSLEIGKPFVGEAADLFYEYSIFLESRNSFDVCESIFSKAIEQHKDYASQETLALIILYFCEFLIRIDRIEKARKTLNNIMQRKNSFNSDFSPAVKKSVPLWCLKCDIEMSLGTVTSVKTIFEQISTYKILTPPFILQYATYLEERDLFDDMFMVYERGVNAFDWPESKEIWVLYLTKFCERYEAQKLDRARELFEQALENCPPDHIFFVLVMYLNLENDFGLFSNQMEVFNHYLSKVPISLCYKLSIIKVSRSIKFIGLLKARRVIEELIELMYGRIKDHHGYEYVLRICLYYASIEKAVGEVERARAVFQYGSQFCDPRKHGFFWDAWYEVELEHGNANTFKEMLRVKRAAIAQFGVAPKVEGFVKSKEAAASDSVIPHEREEEVKDSTEISLE